ncbi:MAG: hypothetical protein UU82_C0034G0009 [Candidatus Nomurabacteria bacterium GW2011_GWC2_41_8]|uniref:Uncharacterized protein n=2 Tax=Candidatus Nomuraibacteriota TaxID=1752729 RepID=A0A1F6YAQ6_9BACT|nr:MAG: hypothetical protein UU82_C0034G0009 [Candidatus Nomurabacteria bacterium GW2011_GWC2_41_8]OGI84752.1 MAG: hypothetical protein A3F49_02780 [Candidatus Nomurabacteria bacterium RIFCSPHIGHO2_12_FULL_42_19]OGI93614.1 MAG: hypothetical protein A3A07_01130 [Candidatus Nomurabacteria bacterium RIFCSPLOWO2_01_FULL_41_52]OGI99319.1 MAG: hypothetical protein A3H56_03595 [Candidatus Nomurabacteria bacterium RIFCSPLOWO2_02_FULL_42_24]OGJ03458.1 MAG: hypothetical protein A3F97_03305 [Candidatus No
MKNIMKNKKSLSDDRQGGFIQLIIIIIVALLVMRYFGITISGILDYFNLTWPDIINWLKEAVTWLKNLFNSVK